MVQPTPVRVIAVTGGKGGVGKTNISVNLAVSMAEMGRRVMLLDADLGLANIDVVLGLHPQYDLSHVLSGERSLEEVVLQGPAGIRVVPGASGVQQMAELSAAEHAGLIRAFSDVGNDLDVLIIDTAAGISDTVVSFSRAAQELIVVVCDEPASITDAYAMIKLLNREYGLDRFRILANMTLQPKRGATCITRCAVSPTSTWMLCLLIWVAFRTTKTSERQSNRKNLWFKPTLAAILQKYSRIWRKRPITGLYRMVPAGTSSSSWSG